MKFLIDIHQHPDHLIAIANLLLWGEEEPKEKVQFLEKKEETYWFKTANQLCYVIIDHRGIIGSGKGWNGEMVKDVYCAISGAAFYHCYQLLEEWGYMLPKKRVSVEEQLKEQYEYYQKLNAVPVIQRNCPLCLQPRHYGKCVVALYREEHKDA